MNVKKIVIVVVILIIAGAATCFVVIRKNYRLNPGVDIIDPAKIQWHKITTSRLNGFAPNLAVVERSEAKTDDSQYLKIEGGLFPFGYWLETSNGSITTRIDSSEKLKEVFAPVDNESEAVSFVAVTTSSYKTDGDMIVGKTATVGDDYLVQVARANDV